MRWSLLMLPPEVVELLISRRRLTNPDFEGGGLRLDYAQRETRRARCRARRAVFHATHPQSRAVCRAESRRPNRRVEGV